MCQGVLALKNIEDKNMGQELRPLTLYNTPECFAVQLETWKKNESFSRNKMAEMQGGLLSKRREDAERSEKKLL